MIVIAISIGDKTHISRGQSSKFVFVSFPSFYIGSLLLIKIKTPKNARHKQITSDFVIYSLSIRKPKSEVKRGTVFWNNATNTIGRCLIAVLVP